MFIRTRKVKGLKYQQLLESFRGEDGTPRHRVVASWTGRSFTQALEWERKHVHDLEEQLATTTAPSLRMRTEKKLGNAKVKLAELEAAEKQIPADEHHAARPQSFIAKLYPNKGPKQRAKEAGVSEHVQKQVEAIANYSKELLDKVASGELTGPQATRQMRWEKKQKRVEALVNQRPDLPPVITELDTCMSIMISSVSNKEHREILLKIVQEDGWQSDRVTPTLEKLSRALAASK